MSDARVEGKGLLKPKDGPALTPLRARSEAWRKAKDVVVRALSGLAALVGIVALGLILYMVLRRGGAALNWEMLTHLPPAVGESGGGVANAILGSMVIVAMSVSLGVPLGVLAGVFLSEFAREGRLGALIRFSANVMMGIPSIIVGLFVYTLVVRPLGHYSGWAGALALAILMVPVVCRTTEDMLHLVPNSLRESALALGAPRWKVTTGVVFRAARTGILTSILLAIARVSGETAPLLFTALNSPFMPFRSLYPAAVIEGVNHPMANLPYTIWQFAGTVYPELQQLAWGAAFLITVSVLGLTISTRILLHKR